MPYCSPAAVSGEAPGPVRLRRGGLGLHEEVDAASRDRAVARPRRQPEVDQRHRAVGTDEHVVRMDVTVQDALAVEVGIGGRGSARRARAAAPAIGGREPPELRRGRLGVAARLPGHGQVRPAVRLAERR